MYIKYDNTKYTCRCRLGAAIKYIGLPEDFPYPANGIISLCADDGFVLRTDNTDNYERQLFSDGTLVLTNEPEVLVEEPESAIESEPTNEEIINVLLGVNDDE